MGIPPAEIDVLVAKLVTGSKDEQAEAARKLSEVAKTAVPVPRKHRTGPDAGAAKRVRDSLAVALFLARARQSVVFLPSPPPWKCAAPTPSTTLNNSRQQPIERFFRSEPCLVYLCIL